MYIEDETTTTTLSSSEEEVDNKTMMMSYSSFTTSTSTSEFESTSTTTSTTTTTINMNYDDDKGQYRSSSSSSSSSFITKKLDFLSNKSLLKPVGRKDELSILSSIYNNNNNNNNNNNCIATTHHDEEEEEEGEETADGEEKTSSSNNNNNNKSNIVFIGAESGSGKSTLVLDQFIRKENLLSLYNNKNNNNNEEDLDYCNDSTRDREGGGGGILCCGQFDQLVSIGGTYTALLHAMEELCTLILMTTTNLHPIQNKIQSEIQGNEYKILWELLENFRRLMHTTTTTEEEEGTTNKSYIKEEDEEEVEEKDRNGDTTNNSITNSSSGSRGSGSLVVSNNNENNNNNNNNVNHSSNDGRNKGNGNDDDNAKDDSSTSSSVLDDVHGFIRFKVAIQSFFTTIGSILSPNKPIVLFLDDLQWADEPVFDVLKFLLHNKNNLMLIGCYRNNEVGPNHPLNKKLIKSLDTSWYTKLELKPLPVMTLNTLISQVLHLDEDTTIDLSKVVHNKTDGNPFFTLQFLIELNQNGLLTKSLLSLQWEWDIDKVKSETTISKNVVEVVSTRIQRLSPTAQEVLKIGSCMGKKFDSRVVEKVFQLTHNRNNHDSHAGGESVNINNNNNKTNQQQSKEEKNVLCDDINNNSSSSSSKNDDDDIVQTGDDRDNEAIHIMVQNALKSAEQDQLLQSVTPTTTAQALSSTANAKGGFSSDLYRFSHDRIQQAAYQLATTATAPTTTAATITKEGIQQKKTGKKGATTMSKTKTATRQSVMKNRQQTLEYHYRIGTVLLEYYRMSKHNNKEAWHLLIGTEQLNIARSFLSENPSKQLELAEMNLESAKITKNKSAFHGAVEFLKVAKELLGPNQFVDHPKLAFEVQMMYARMGFCSGSSRHALQLIDELLNDDHCETIEERMEAYSLKTEILYAQKENRENFPIIATAVSDAGVKVPSLNVIEMIKSLLKTKRILKKYSIDDILAIQPTKDHVHLAVMDLLMNGRVSAFFINHKPAYVIYTTLLIQMSLKWGVSKFSPSAFAAWGVVLANLGDFARAKEYGELAHQLSARIEFRGGSAKMNVIYGGFLKHIYRPFSECVHAPAEGYRVGMEMGDISYAFLCALVSLGCRFWNSYPLRPLLKDTRRILQEMDDYKIGFAFDNGSVFAQLISNLIQPRPSDPGVLEGEFIPNLDQFTRKVKATYGHDDFCVRQISMFAMWNALFYDDLELGEKYATKMLKVKSVDFPVWYSTLSPLVRGLIFLDLYQNGKKRRQRWKYRRLAMKELALLEKWSQAGFINIPFQKLILKAQIQAVDKPSTRHSESVRLAYDKAITMASKSGFSLYAAITNERAARYFLDKDVQQSSYYVNRALDLMEEWGAIGWVQFTMKKYGLSPKSRRSFIRRGSYLIDRNKLDPATSIHKEADWISPRGESALLAAVDNES